MKGSSASGIGSALLFGRQMGPNTPGPTIPVNTVAPVISGTTYLHSVLTCSTGTWTGGGTMAYTYQWKRAGVNISGQTNATYTMVQADTVDTLPQITCEVLATNEAGPALTPTASSNSILCTPVILMSVNKTAGSMGFTGSLTRKASSPTTVVIQWGDTSATTPTAAITKTYATSGVKNIRVYAELNNILTFNITTITTRLVSFTATEPISSITTISILNQTTAGMFTTFTAKNLPALATITLTSSTLTALTSTQIDNLPSLANLNISSMGALTNVTLPVFPVLSVVNASLCLTLATVSINNNPSITNLNLSRCLLTSLNISALVNLTTLTLGNASSGNVLSALDVSTNVNLTNLNAQNIGLSTFTYSTLNNAVVINLGTNSLSGSYSFTSPSLVSLTVSNNSISTLSVSSIVLIDMICNNNVITDLNLLGKTVCANINVGSNHIGDTELSDMLADLVSNGTLNGNFIGTSQTPPATLNAQGLLDKATLESRTWTVTV